MADASSSAWRQHDIIHSVRGQRRGWPNLPFVAVVEAFVLRALRALGYSQQQIKAASDGVRRAFGDEYGLARPGVGHDEGREIFFEVGGHLFRAKDSQQALRETVADFRTFITWQGDDPQRLQLAQLGNVYLDPRFGWGRPVVGSSLVPVPSIMGLWYAGEGVSTIAAEFDMAGVEVQRVIQAWSRAHDRLSA